MEGKVENLSPKAGKLDRHMVNVEQRMEKSEARTQVCEKEIAENKSVTNMMVKNCCSLEWKTGGDTRVGGKGSLKNIHILGILAMEKRPQTMNFD